MTILIVFAIAILGFGGLAIYAFFNDNLFEMLFGDGLREGNEKGGCFYGFLKATAILLILGFIGYGILANIKVECDAECQDYEPPSTNTNNGPGTHYTKDYYRKDGTHVSGYKATNPDGNPDNNFSSK